MSEEDELDEWSREVRNNTKDLLSEKEKVDLNSPEFLTFLDALEKAFEKDGFKIFDYAPSLPPKGYLQANYDKKGADLKINRIPLYDKCSECKGVIHPPSISYLCPKCLEKERNNLQEKHKLNGFINRFGKSKKEKRGKMGNECRRRET